MKVASHRFNEEEKRYSAEVPPQIFNQDIIKR